MFGSSKIDWKEAVEKVKMADIQGDLLSNALYIQDLDTASRVIGNMSLLADSKVLVTGAGGLVCSAFVDLLLYMSEIYGLNITVYAAGRSERQIKSRFHDKAVFVHYDAMQTIDFDFSADYIVHGAGNADPQLYLSEPVETMLANIIGMKNLLEYAKSTDVKKVLYISSSEVYGKKESIDPYKEEQYGFVDLLHVRSCYPNSKRATETLCSSYKSEYGVDFNVVRPGHIYGPTAKATDSKISSAFAYKAARGEDLMMKSDGKQLRSYCYCLDCATAMIYVLLKGISGEAYNISNEKSVISIKEMAEYIAEAGGVDLKFELPTNGEIKAFNPMDNSSLDNSKLRSLGWNGCFPPKTGFMHTVQILSEIYKEQNGSVREV